MIEQVFTWDPNKAKRNVAKHHFSFEKAAEVFLDPNSKSSISFENGEERWITIGMVDNFVILFVVHTVSEEEENGEFVEKIRIISARKANKKERDVYYG